ncbi:hypothetical protein [Acinetobacter sp. WZC-1]|uniref:hypothetical protein n=1 Tax=Acinetobacter sp. WZC-1 TaxID=3459034 RepID=UPI00403D73FB
MHTDGYVQHSFLLWSVKTKISNRQDDEPFSTDFVIFPSGIVFILPVVESGKISSTYRKNKKIFARTFYFLFIFYTVKSHKSKKTTMLLSCYKKTIL